MEIVIIKVCHILQTSQWKSADIIVITDSEQITGIFNIIMHSRISVGTYKCT